MRYKLICVNNEGSFTIREEEIEKVIKGRKENKPTIFTEGIVLNWNMYSGIVPDYERERQLAEAKQRNYKLEEPSPFAKLLSPKMKMLSDEKRTEVLEEVAKQERKNKR